MTNVNYFQMAKVQLQVVLLSICLIFFANFSLALLIKVLLIKQVCSQQLSDSLHDRLMQYLTDDDHDLIPKSENESGVE